MATWCERGEGQRAFFVHHRGGVLDKEREKQSKPGEREYSRVVRKEPSQTKKKERKP